MRRRTDVRYGRFAKIALASVMIIGGMGASVFAHGEPETRDGETTVDLLGIQSQFEKIADRVSPSVVAVSAAESREANDNVPPADQMNPDRLRTELNKGVRTVGTGFVVDSDGYILTNDHVVAHAQQLWITTDDGKVYPAMIVASDPVTDLAVLKTSAEDLPAVQFADGESIHRGMWSIALGNPYGLATDGDMSLAAGVVSAVNRSLPKLSHDEHRMYSGLIQTTAEINPGNSGGPLVDIDGRVIGINVAVILPDKQTNGIGFAIPVDARTMRIIHDLKNAEPITHGFFGVTLSEATPSQRRQQRIPEDVGVEVEHIVPGSPAGVSTLATGDIVASFDGEMVHSTEQLAQLINDASLDHASRLIVYRKGRVMSVDVHAASQPAEASTQIPAMQRMNWNGMLLAPLPANWTQGGVMVLALTANSPAAHQGIRPGSIITGVAGKLISNLEQLRQIVGDTPVTQCALQTAEGTERVAAASGK